MAAQPEAESFSASYGEYLKSVGRAMKCPKFAGKVVDLCELFRGVMELGGYDAIGTGWRALAVQHGKEYSKTNTGGTAQIRKVYQKWLLAYEDNRTFLATGNEVVRASDGGEVCKKRRVEDTVYGLTVCQCHALDSLFDIN